MEYIKRQELTEIKNNLNLHLIENPNKEPKECKTIRGSMQIWSSNMERKYFETFEAMYREDSICNRKEAYSQQNIIEKRWKTL